jgi:hypothetical protein
MNTLTIRKKLHQYIEVAQEKKVKAIFAMVEDEIEETGNHWNDERFVAELQRREISYLEGKAKTYTLEQTLARTKRSIKKTKSK